MGFFKRFLSAPRLTPGDAIMVAQEIAALGKSKHYSVPQFVGEMQNLLSAVIDSEYPGYAVDPEEAREIARHALDILQNS